MQTGGKIGDGCDAIEQRMSKFREDSDAIFDLQWCLRKLAQLRRQYHESPREFEPHMERVKSLSRQVREAALACREKLTAKYIEAAGAVSAWEAIQEACREALLESAGPGDVQRFDSPVGWVEIRRSKASKLPKPGTTEREQLLAVISQAQAWPDVAFPSAPRLSKAIDAGLFTPQQAAEIARLCPMHVVSRLSVHPL